MSRADLVEEAVGGAERVVDRPHVGPAQHGEDGDGGAVAGRDAARAPGRANRREVGRAEHVGGPVEDLEDLVLAVDVVAHGHDVHAGVDQLLVAAEGQPRAAGGVLGVADDQADAPARDEPGQDLADDLAARRADDIADEQDFQGHEGLISCRRGRAGSSRFSFLGGPPE